MNRTAILSLTIAGLLSLPACAIVDNTVDTIASIEIPTFFSTNATDSSKTPRRESMPTAPDNCPKVQLVKDLSSLTQFEDPASPRESRKISETSITRLNSSCAYENENVNIELYITFDGKIGPKGRMRPGDEAFFSYPYFIAITDENNEIISKDVFGVSFSYPKGKNEQTYSNQVSQSIPTPDKAAGKNYNVLVGFQLTQEELSYNRSNMMD